MKREEKQRIASLLEQDKEELNAESRAAAIRDFLRVAREYFEPEGNLTLSLTREKHNFAVSVTFRASRVKNFTPIK